MTNICTTSASPASRKSRVGPWPAFLVLSVAVVVQSLATHVTIGFGQETTAAIRGVKDASGFDADKLGKINEVMQKALSQGRIVGCSALVFKNGKEVFFNTCGLRNSKKEKPLQRDTIFRIYSMSKPITSVAVMQLVEQGKIGLDEPVAKYLPEFAELKVAKPGAGSNNGEIETVEPKRAMTVRDLLRHTSGLTYGFFDRTPVDQLYVKRGVLTTDKNLSETVTKLSKIPLKRHPGTRFEYGVSTDVLGRLVEVVSGQPFDEYLNDQVFSPLEMKDTHFTLPADKLDRLAEMYRDGPGGKLTASPPLASFRFTNQRNKFYSGGGGLCSTIDDYLNFSKMLLNDGKFNGKQVIKKETLELMFTDQLGSIESPPGRGFKFGLGLSISERKKGTDYSWGGIAGTRFWVNPELNMVSIFMTQINPYGRRNYGEQIRDIAYDALQD